MDDGDLGNNIDEAAKETEDGLSPQSRFQNDEAHLEPSRWWFASSAFPMIAGTLGPVASAFSICALGRPWRQHFPPGTNIDKATFNIPDPKWLIAINAVQLVMALVANVFLLLNMARRVRFDIAQPITIIGWYVSAICLVALAATASGPLLHDIPKGIPVDEVIWSAAFWFGVWAAILYFIDASLMVVTFWGAQTHHYPRDFRLTTSQRTLMLQTIMFLVYMLLGALVFSHIEGWNYLDGVYWADVTLFTVGFGDFAAKTALGRALLFPYALVGVISLGLVIGSIRSMVLERGKRRLDARMEEKKRRQTVKSMARHGKDNLLEPIDTLDDDAPTTVDGQDSTNLNEYERRKAEFQLMRQIQIRAGNRRRWMAMVISTSSWLVLWLVGAVIFLEAEKPYQPQWSYYSAFYFCFVSLTTIGYGDVTPISPCGKSFFVFWSLLALPTMTILISNAGDTVVAYVRDGTIRLGTITILPGEEGFMGSLKHVVHRLSCGLIFKKGTHEEEAESSESRKPEFHEKIDGPSDEEDHDHPVDQNNGADRGRSRDHLDIEAFPGSRRDRSQGVTSTYTAKIRRSLSRLRDPLDKLPTGTDLHFLLISEIKEVSKHMRFKNPKRYSYEEWAWYLRLIGEDERSPDTHRKARARRHPNKAHHGQKKQEGPEKSDPEDEELSKWSWVGHRSPLMGSQEESEWILDRLTDRLRESLSFESKKTQKVA